MPTVLVDLLQSTGTKGGIEIYAQELYRHIGRMNSRYEFVGYGSRELMSTDTSWFPGEVVDSRISGENRLSWAVGELFAVSRAARKAGVDLIHCPAMFAPLRSRIPVVVSVHDLLYFSHPELMRTPFFTEPVKWMEKRAAATATRMITISQFSARAIARYLDVSSDKLTVIPLAGRSMPPAAETSSVVVREHDLFLSVGQRSPYKDFETIVRAWALIEEHQRPRLVITGSHGDDPLIALVGELGLERWVDLRSWISSSDLASLFSESTALIDATLATGFSMPTLEAMTVGLPVLLADTEVFREVGGDAADYFTAGNPASLSRAVMMLVGDRHRRESLSTSGRERSATYSWTRVAEQTLAVFDLAISPES